jgi:phage-related minor tail protein
MSRAPTLPDSRQQDANTDTVEPMQISTAASNKDGGRMRLSLEAASHWFDISSIALAFGACIVFVATAAIVWLGIVKEHHWDVARDKASRDIANLSSQNEQLRKDTAVANAEAARANEAAGKAHERAAALETDAEKARASIAEANVRSAELAKDVALARKETAEANARAVEAQLALEKFKAPRLLTPEQRRTITEKLRPFAGMRVAIAPSPESFEAGMLAEQLVEVLKSAGINATPNLGAVQTHIGLAKGVIARHVTGNELASRFAYEFAKSLTEDGGVPSSSMNDLMENIMPKMIEQGHARNDPGYHWVVVAVGDKV